MCGSIPCRYRFIEAQAARPGDQVLAEVGRLLDALRDVAVERAAFVCSISHS